MPRLPHLDPSDPALPEKVIEFAEREARELADIGIGMLADALKRRLKQRRLGPASTGSLQKNGRHPASPYAVLGVSPETPMEEIEQVFRKRVMVCHPDKGGDADEFRLVVDAMRQIRLESKI